ncbi:MAG: DsrE family protein [Methanoregula sp.]|nr:DsrE family protein [Methanoregula sp.]
MASQFFLFTGTITQERLSWIEEGLKFFFMRLYPESLLHHAKKDDFAFTFLLTGDSLYSLIDPGTQPLWEILLSLPSVRIICDRKELDLRGIAVERLKMRNPDQVIDHNSLGLNGRQSFWKDVVKLARQNEEPAPSTIGYLQLDSPYMHRTALYPLLCLSAALEVHASIDLYAYLDGVHLGHTGQNPTDAQNIGAGLEDLNDRAAKRGLQCQMIACGRCATARGYSTWDDGQGAVISTCAIRPFRIREMNAIVEQFKRNHIILGESAGDIQLRRDNPSSAFNRPERGSQLPPITILITKTPYGSERTYGALSLAAACAHEGITTRVVFIEDGVHALTGTQVIDPESRIFNVQELIDVIAGTANLQMYAFTPSLQMRNLAKNRKLTAVLDLGIPELGQILFYPAGNSFADHQRIIFF